MEVGGKGIVWIWWRDERGERRRMVWRRGWKRARIWVGKLWGRMRVCWEWGWILFNGGGMMEGVGLGR